MQYRVYDRTTLAYRDGGFARSWNIDNDYINNNNSSIDIVNAANNSSVGDIVCLIESTGAYDKGIITSIDNESLQICYKSDKELFNDNILNPLASEFTNDTELKVAGKFGIDMVANLIDVYWGRSIDIYKRLPMTIIKDGDVLDENNNARMLWTWQDSQINFSDWLIDLFKSYSVVLNFDIDFDEANELSERKPKYIITISAVSNDNEIIKDNVATQKITYTKTTLPEKTCCIVIDKDTKEILTTTSGTNLFNPTYAVEDAYLESNNGMAYDVSYSQDAPTQESRVSSYIIVNGGLSYVISMNAVADNVIRNVFFYDNNGQVIQFSQNNEIVNHLEYENLTSSGEFVFTVPSNTKKIRFCYPKNATQIQFEQGAHKTNYQETYYKAIYYLAINDSGVYYVTPNVNDENRILPIRTTYVEYSSGGEAITVLDTAKNELAPNSFNQAIEIEIPKDTKMFNFEFANFGDVYKIITKNGTITSIYSGRKESSDNNIVTVLFGLGRKNYTDLINETLRGRKYQKVYNK